MIATRPMPIKRSWVRTIVWTLVMFLLLCLAGFMAHSGDYPVAGLLAILGLAALLSIGAGSYVTHCPRCEKELRGLMGLRRCSQCLCYGKVSEGMYYELQPDYVTDVPSLALPLGDRRELPPLCCACGAPAVRSEKLRIIRLEFAFDLDAPHCSLHTGGADLDSEPIAGKGKRDAPVLKVKSYAFYRACVKANYGSSYHLHDENDRLAKSLGSVAEIS